MQGIGAHRHKVTVQNPGQPQPDGDGGFTEGWADAVPAQLDVSITPASARDLERYTAGTTFTSATHMVRGRWHPQITTASRLLFQGRALLVVFVSNPEERSREVILICAEVLNDPAAAAAGVGTWKDVN